MSLKNILTAGALMLAVQVHTAAHAQSPAQQPLPTAGTLVIVPAYGEVTQPNDQATVSFTIEEQDKDKAVAASRVNQKMKQGTDIVRREDREAQLKTLGYFTYPVYDEQPPIPVDGRPVQRTRKQIGWRVGQQLEVKTTNLSNLQKMTAQVQRVLGLNGVHFGLSPQATKKLDDKRIAATYQNLGERIASIASAMGRRVSDATIETVDFEGSGQYGEQVANDVAPMAMRSMAKAESAEVAEPSFEPGETTLHMRLVGKVRFK